jgi:LPXTG-motif cell wall-anchored protein
MYNNHIYDSFEEGIKVKKALCPLLALLFTLMFATVVFAATDNNDPLLSTSPDTVINAQYGEKTDEIDPETDFTMEIMEEEIPQALPQTGGVPAEVFYIIGGICIISAILLLSRKSNTSTK